MYELLLNVVNMSYAASVVIIAVLILRLLMRKLPKLFTYFLWALVLIRLLCPFEFETVWSVIPSAQLVSTDLIQLKTFEIHSGISLIDLPINEALIRGYYEGVTVPLGTMQRVVGILVEIWLCGVLAIMIVGIVRGLRGRRQMLKTAKPIRIVVAVLMWVVLALHWMNPVVWLGYWMVKRDLPTVSEEEKTKYPGERWVAGILIVLAFLLVFSGNPVQREKNLTVGVYGTQKLLYSEEVVKDPLDARIMPQFEVTELRDLLVDGQNAGRLVATTRERVNDQNFIVMSGDGQRYGDQHIDNKEVYQTDPLPDGTYYVVNAYEPEKLEILQIQGVYLWKVYAVEME